MFTMDVPYVPVQDTPIVLAQAATPGVALQPDYLLKACSEFSSGGGVVDPAGMLAVYLGNRSNRSISSNHAAMASIKIVMLESTKHGELAAEVDNIGESSYLYAVEPGYLGKDKAVFMAEFEGKRYKVVINFVITEGINENDPQCPKPELIKLIKPSSGSSGFDLNSITVTFADLDGSALGLTNVSGITNNRGQTTFSAN